MIIMWVVTFAVSQLLAPEPDVEDAKAATLNDFNFPTATEGRIIPLVWGTDEIKGPNVLWYGGLQTVPITETIKVSMFKKKDIVTGHQYYVSIQMGICLGPVALRKVWIGDELAWSGNQTTDGTVNLSVKGCKGVFEFYTGSKTQAVNTYLATQQSPCPAYRGMSYGVFKNGYVGTSPDVKAFSFEVSRLPSGLGSTNPIVNTYDANPMEMAYEVLTSTAFGYGYPSSDIDTTEFKSVADTLYTEGNGMSLSLQAQREAKSLLTEIEKQIDGRFRIDPTTGKWRIVLARDGYSIGSLRAANNGNIKEVRDFSRAAWEETFNHVRIQYKRRGNKYTQGYAPAQDGANMRIQNRTVPVTWTYEGVKDDTLANKIAWRELRTHSYPLAKARLVMDRTFWDAYVGEVIRFSYSSGALDITDLPMRITRIDTGNKDNPEIVVDCVQDVFAWKAASFADPDTTNWTAPDKNLIPFPSAQQVGFEAPYGFTRRHEVTTEGRIFVSGVSQGREEIGYLVRQRNAVGTPSGSFYDAGQINDFMYVGTLDSAIDNDDSTIDVLTTMNLAEIMESNAADVGNELTNLIMIGDEFVACTGASTITGGLRLTGCYRGLLDSAQASHASGAAVRFIFVGGDLTVTAFPLTNNVDIRLLPFDFNGDQVSESDGGLTTISLTMANRERRPYPPTFMDLNSTQYPSGSVSMDVQQGTIEDDKGIKVEFNRRDYRIYDEVSQNHTDASTINGDFPSNNTTQYALEVWKDPSGTPSLLYTTGWQATATDYAYRTAILRYMAGVIPSELRIKIKTRHTFSSVVYEATQTLDWDFDTTSAELSGDHNFGVLGNLAVSTSWTAPTTGTYNCTIGRANTSGPIEYRLNGGSWVTCIATSSTTGSMTGVTASDTIEIRANGLALGGGATETLFRADSPSSAVDAYAVFVP